MAETAQDPASVRGRRIAQGVFLVVAAWFAISSTWQITKSALIDPPPSSPSQ